MLLKHLKNKLKTYLLRHALNYVVVEDVLTTDKQGRAYLRGKVLTEQQIRSLHNEALTISRTLLWKILTETLKEQAQERVLSKATDFDGVTGGRAMLHNISVQEKIVQSFVDLKDKGIV